MFQTRSWRRRRSDSRSNRRSKQQRNQTRSRRLGLEALEPRQLLCATLFDSGSLPHGLGIASTHTEPQYVQGTAFEFVADPAFAGSLEAGEPGGPIANALHPLNSIPQLHSNPGATAKLFLDFDGHFEPDPGGGAGTTTSVYDFDGDGTSFSDAELESIYSARDGNSRWPSVC